ncbi:MAG: NADH-quinone oxidoreductase subunit J/K, partial [Candidatus Omnitrophica bacterium]|nr:NADH-quinone oxidoreductase subunit J/K [Candidatus Omnitrophota bacterium]
MSQFKKIVLLKNTDTEKSPKDFFDAFLAKIREQKLENEIQIVRASDVGVYKKGIVLKIYPDNLTYAHVKDEDIDAVIEKTLKNNQVINELLFTPKDKQIRVVLRNCGVINPENIEDYIAHDGYLALEKALQKDSPEDVIKEMEISGLRGRGGGGFPTWMKWDFARSQQTDQRYIICNGDEGDPGAYMDRSVLEGDPHSVVEGM